MAILPSSTRSRAGARWLLLAGLLGLSSSLGYGQAKNSCLDCHSTLPDPIGVTQDKFSQDIHAQKGLTCVSCHGGDATSDDADQAMSRKAGWKGKIDRKQIPALCGSCHSDPAYMRAIANREDLDCRQIEQRRVQDDAPERESIICAQGLSKKCRRESEVPKKLPAQSHRP